MPTPPTWDDLDTTDWDTLYTYDDPMQSYRIRTAIDLGTVTRDGPSAAIAWTEAGDVVDGLEPSFARDHFTRSGSVDTVLNSNPYFTGGVTSGWTASGGAALSADTLFVHEGTHSMVITPNGVTSDPQAVTADIAILGGRKYTVSVWNRTTVSGDRSFGVVWLDSGLVSLGTSMMTAADTPGTWTFHQQTYQAPAAAVWGRLITIGSGVLAAGNTWRVDEFKLIGPVSAAAGFGTTDLPVPGYPWTVNSVYMTTDGENAVCTPNLLNSLYTATLDTIPSVVDFDLAMKVRATGLFTGASGSVFLLARWQDASNHHRFRLDFNIDQIIGMGIETRVAGVDTANTSGLSLGPLHTTAGWLWIRAQGQGSTIRMKVWTDGQTQPDDWSLTRVDTTYATTPGIVGIGFRLTTGNTNSLPYDRFEVAEFFSGVNAAVDVNKISTTMSMDDGLPTGASDSSNSGVPDMSAELMAPVGTPSRVYWSTFRQDQPYWDIDRDVAGVAVSSGLVTDDGIRTSRLFTGQMSDMPVSGDQVALKGISRNRLRMTTAVQPPAINGPYEGCEGTWPVSYAMFKSGVYAAPPPIPGCRMYIPFHGSTHPMVPDTNGEAWPYGLRSFSSPSTSNWVRPTFVDGPFVAGLYCHMGPEATLSFSTNVDIANFAPGDDFFSQRNSKARIEFWVRGDPTDLAASQNNTESFIGHVWLQENSGPGRYILLGIGCPDRRPYLQMFDGVGTASIKLDPVPSDGKWHFIAASWNFDPAGPQRVRMTMDTQTITIAATAMSAANLPLVDSSDLRLRFKMYLPISEFRMTTGRFGSYQQASWVRDVPFTPKAIIRRSSIELEGLAETVPVEAYSYINRFAQADLSWTGYNEQDQFCYLPPKYWGETDQQIVEETLSPDTNLGSDFTPVRDVNRVYNEVAVTYKASTVQQGITKIYESSELLTLPPHQEVDVTFATQVPVIQMRDYGFALPDGAYLAANPPNPYNYANYVTANTTTDGLGTYATIFTLKVTVVSWTPGSITLRFLNNLSTPLYTVNHVNLPSIGIGGKTLMVADDTFIATSGSSIARRNIRTLPVQNDAIQRLNDAAGLARELVARLSQPRIRFTAKLFADPERRPGRLVRVEDPYVTGMSGLFRLTSVATTQEGHDIKQVVSAHESIPVLVWGVGAWGETVWGEAAE